MKCKREIVVFAMKYIEIPAICTKVVFSLYNPPRYF